MLELLAVIAVIGMTLAIGVANIAAGKGAARVKGATRDIFGAIRHARSVALVTGQPAVITYSTEEEDGEVVAKVEVVTAKLFDSNVDRSKVETLSGEAPRGEGYELVHIEGSEAKPVGERKEEGAAAAEGADGVSAAGDASSPGGETVEDILFAPINTDIVKGMRLKVLKGDEELQQEDTGRKTKISVFSNVDYLIGRLKDTRAAAKKKDAGSDSAASRDEGGRQDDASRHDDDQEPVSVVWETNGRVEPHQVWVYADGQKPEDGLLIRVDRFGAAKVLNGNGREEE